MRWRRNWCPIGSLRPSIPNFTSARINDIRTRVVGCHPVKRRSFHHKNVSQTPSTTETLSAAHQQIEVEQKCDKRRKRRNNASVWRDNSSIPDNNDNKDESSNIIYEERDNRRVSDLEHLIQHFKDKAHYKASNYQCSINTCQEKVDISEDMMKAEREDGRQEMHCLEEYLAETRKNSSDIVSEASCYARRQISEMENKVYIKF